MNAKNWTHDERINQALEIAFLYAGIDGGHHKSWVIDQMLRKLLGQAYMSWIEEWRDGEDGPDTYKWDEGIAP